MVGSPDATVPDIEALSDEQLDSLAAKLGISGADDDDSTQADAGTDGGAPADPKVEDGDSKQTPPATSQGLPLTGQALIDQLQNSPEAQELIRAQLTSWYQTASAEADAKKEQEDFKKLIESGDFEEIGRRYVQADARKTIETKAQEEARLEAFGSVYKSLFAQPELAQMNDEEKVKLNPDKFPTDEEYVLALTEHIASKRGSAAADTRANELVNEKLTALKNMRAGQAGTVPSPSAIPSGAPGSATNGKQTSRSLIQEGFHEVLEAAAEDRGAVIV